MIKDFSQGGTSTVRSDGAGAPVSVSRKSMVLGSKYLAKRRYCTRVGYYLGEQFSKYHYYFLIIKRSAWKGQGAVDTFLHYAKG